MASLFHSVSDHQNCFLDASTLQRLRFKQMRKLRLSRTNVTSYARSLKLTGLVLQATYEVLRKGNEAKWVSANRAMSDVLFPLLMFQWKWLYHPPQIEIINSYQGKRVEIRFLHLFAFILVGYQGIGMYVFLSRSLVVGTWRNGPASTNFHQIETLPDFPWREGVVRFVEHRDNLIFTNSSERKGLPFPRPYAEISNFCKS